MPLVDTLTWLCVTRSICYDMNSTKESYEFFDIRNSEPDDCRLTKVKADMRQLAQAPTAAKAAPRAVGLGAARGPSNAKGRGSAVRAY